MRSTSFPESASPQPNLRLTQVRSHGQTGYERVFTPRARDVAATGLIPLSTQEEDYTTAGAKADMSFQPATYSSADYTSTRSPQQTFSPSTDTDSLNHAFDAFHLREGAAPRDLGSSSRMPFAVHRTSIPAPLREDLTAVRSTPSPTFSMPDNDFETYKRALALQRRPTSSRTEQLVNNPTTREYAVRRGHSLLQMPMPQTPDQQRQAQLTEEEVMCLRLRDEVRLHVPDSDYPFLNGGPPNFNISEYPTDVQKVVASLHQSSQARQGAQQSSLEIAPRQETAYMVVVFKLQRAAIYYRPEEMTFTSEIKSGDMIVVQADRGEDIGCVWNVTSNVLEAEEIARQLNLDHLRNLLSFVKLFTTAANRLSRTYVQPSHGQDLVFKSIIRKAGQPEAKRLVEKEHDETKAKRIAEQKARERSLPMEILDAEFQADHGKLTIYYISEQYIVFKEFVDDMYKVYKMRVWMSSVNQVRPSR